LMVVASVFASVWRKNHPEKMCVILNISETQVAQLSLQQLKSSQKEFSSNHHPTPWTATRNHHDGPCFFLT